MLDALLLQVLLLLGVTVVIILVFQRLQLPPSLAYLLVGVLLGAHTAGPVIDEHYLGLIAEFGIVFLLFTIGLSFSLQHIYALRHTILSLGTAQVAFTTLVVALLLWWAGLEPTAAFVIGAVFAQSSTTIIVRQLSDQGEDQTRHGRLGTTLSVFQDITAVPFVIVIPVLGVAATHEIASSLGWALLKALLAFALVYIFGRYLLRGFFHLVVAKRSAELFTLTVLFVSLCAAWITKSLGLSMAFGAFLIGMMLSETEFRHQVEVTIQPFRDVLLGLFFISIGMLFDPSLVPAIWKEALLGALFLLGVKILLVTLIVRVAGVNIFTAFRTGMLLAVGGEFGFALLALGLEASLLPQLNAQIALTSVLISMVIAPFLIRYNHAIASWIFAQRQEKQGEELNNQNVADKAAQLKDHVVICGFGRTGQVVARFLEQEKITYIAADLEAQRVKEARLAGQPVYYGDSTHPHVLDAMGVQRAKLVIISHDDLASALQSLVHIREMNPNVTIMVRTRDELHVDQLRAAGANEVIPETLEAGMMLVSHTLLAMQLPLWKIARHIQEQRYGRYQMLREMFKSGTEHLLQPQEARNDQLHSWQIDEESRLVGLSLADLELDAENLVVTALVRQGQRRLNPQPSTVLEADDVLVLFGTQEAIERAKARRELPV